MSNPAITTRDFFSFCVLSVDIWFGYDGSVTRALFLSESTAAMARGFAKTREFDYSNVGKAGRYDSELVS